MLIVILPVIMFLIEGSLAQNSDVVWGQAGSFISAIPNNGGVSATSLNSPNAIAVDSSGGVYVSDGNCNRVLYYPKGSVAATIVWGQSGSFTSNDQNKNGISAVSLLFPKGVAVDNIGNVLIADTANTRVLFYPKGSTTSNRVYGQGGSFTSSTENLGGISATSINRAFGVGFDSNNNVYICDTENHRVLFYAGNSVTASRVYGQPSFTTSSGFGIGASASSLDSPMAITFDKSGNVYIADSSANRITIYTGTATVASAVVGQASFTTFASGLSASALNNPMGIALDASNNLYISDEVNNRVLKFSSGASSASSVIGQQGSFTSGNQNQGTISSSSLAFPLGIAIDVNNSLYVCDSQNNRLLCFGCPTSGTTTTGSTTTKPAFANNLVPQVLLLGLVLCFA